MPYTRIFFIIPVIFLWVTACENPTKENYSLKETPSAGFHSDSTNTGNEAVLENVDQEEIIPVTTSPSGINNRASEIKQTARKSENNEDVSRKIQRDKTDLDNTNKYLSSITSKTEFFTINNSKLNSIITTRGSEVKIPKDCFINSKGLYERGEIKLEISELTSAAQMFTQNLPTRSGEKLLISDGVIYINAKSKTENLSIAEGKTIQVNYAANAIDPDMLIFTLQDINGDRNWVNPVKPENKIKKHYLNSEISFVWEIQPLWKNTESNSMKKSTAVSEMKLVSRYKLNKNGSEEIKKEYFERLKLISALNSISKAHQNNTNAESYLEYYINSPGNDFYSIDQKIYDFLIKNEDLFKNTWTYYCIEQERNEDTIYYGYNEIKDRFYLYTLKKGWMTDEVISKYLNKELNTTPDKLREIESYIRTKNEIENKRKNAKVKYKTDYSGVTESKNAAVIYYTISISNLGYINIDKFYNEPNLISSETVVNLSGINDYVKVGMVFKNRKSFLPIYINREGKFHLKTDLPSDEPVKIIAINYKDDQLSYSEQQIFIKPFNEINLSLNPITKEELISVLEK
ncbi:MAG: hypothetical protein ACK40G_15655 [Cytophagaceae bacterium]